MRAIYVFIFLLVGAKTSVIGEDFVNAKAEQDSEVRSAEQAYETSTGLSPSMEHVFGTLKETPVDNWTRLSSALELVRAKFAGNTQLLSTIEQIYSSHDSVYIKYLCAGAISESEPKEAIAWYTAILEDKTAELTWRLHSAIELTDLGHPAGTLILDEALSSGRGSIRNNALSLFVRLKKYNNTSVEGKKLDLKGMIDKKQSLDPSFKAHLEKALSDSQ